MSAFKVNSDFDKTYPDGSASATECSMNLVYAAELLQLRISRLLRPFTITPASGLALGILADAEVPMQPNQIAERMIVTRATVTGLLDSLERRKLVKRNNHPSDRRMLLVEITKEGRRVAADFRAIVHARQRQWFEVLTEKERELLLQMLGRVQERLREND